MLAERFDEALEALAAAAAEREQARNERDEFIEEKFPELDAAFSNMVTAVTGNHPKLAVIKTVVTDTFTGRGFATLNKTVIDVRSTLYGPVEEVRFTPALESVDVDQFGVVRIATQGLRPSMGSGLAAALLESMLKRGILMRGSESAHLVVAEGERLEELVPQQLEDFLTALFIRTS